MVEVERIVFMKSELLVGDSIVILLCLLKKKEVEICIF